ncbi:MAG TPA: M1 family metallopeptidase [Steroidobacteraceae bacterium]
MRSVLLFAALCLGALNGQAEAPFRFAATPGPLPKTVVPSAYRLDLAPDLEQLKFTGREEIDVEVSAPTDVVTLNAADLNIESVALAHEPDAKAQISLDAPKQTATFRFAHQLASGRHTLALVYSGHIPATPAGIYYNDYATASGTERMLVTQFEALDARRMFPGWDEPAFKATFQLSVELPSDLVVVSNTPVASEAPAGKSASGAPLKKTAFMITPRMSTYLVVLCAGHLQRINDTSTGTDIGVWTVAGKAEQGREALQDAVKILKYYNGYFALPYPLPKLDLIAVPGNYAAGAMENWGGITFIDNALLMDPESSSEATRQTIFAIVAHEMAHQWSGDLVTMAWWNDLWLNEGFASWMGTKSTDALNPDWLVWLREHASKERAMSGDARATTHPIQMHIADDSEVETAFDSISYNKGEAFLRMLETYLGEDAFRDGMRHYMKAHAYSNTTTGDLWSALETASGKPVAEIAAGFTEQPGIPLIRVTVSCQRGNTVAALKQERFTVNDPTAAKLNWNVPVQIGVVGGTAAARTVLVGKEEQGATFTGCGKPVKANLGDAGYYRVQYDKSALVALTSAFKALSAADRVSLLADEWALVVAGRSSVGSYLELTRQLADENTLVVWTDVIAHLREIDDLERHAPVRTAFRHYALQVLAPAFARTGWDAQPGENNQVGLLRVALLSALARFGDPAVIAEGKRRFAAFLVDPRTLAPNLRSPVIDMVGRYADQTTFDKLRVLGRAASSTEDKLRYYFALAAAQDPVFIDQNVKVALTAEITNGRVNQFLIQLALQSNDPELVWQAVLAKRAPILAKLPPGRRGFLLPAIAQASANPALADELLALPEEQASKGARYEAEKAAARINEQAVLKKNLLPALPQWLGSH